MKRILPLLFLLALLCGCKNSEPAPTTPAAPPVQTGPGTYIADSRFEKETGGALRQYAVEGEIAWIAPFGEHVLLAGAGKTTTLTVLSGGEGVVLATVKLPVKLETDGPWQVTKDGFAYYQSADRKVMYLDEKLTPSRAVQLPESITGDPVITADCKEIFYCEGRTVYAMDAQRKISRPVRTNTCLQQTLMGCYWGGKIVRCHVQDETGRWHYQYISAESGETLYTEKYVQQLYTTNTHYFAACLDGSVMQFLFGTKDQKQRLLVPGQVYASLGLNGAFGVESASDKTTVSFYELTGCKKTASVSFSGKLNCKDLAEDVTGGAWLLTQDNVLLHWDMRKSAVTENKVYTGIIYTAQFPDAAGLLSCTQRAEALSGAYNMDIRVWDQAIPEGVAVTPEYQVKSITDALDALETEFKKFPANFLTESVPGKLHIYIVREIEGDAVSTYRWINGEAYILLAVSSNDGQSFLDVFSYILDIHVLSNSPKVDDWGSMNPDDFVYGSETADSAYLEGESRAFADRRATNTVTDDRARTFYYAMQSGNEEMFASSVMQQKLLTLCKAIRDAWNLKKSPDTYLWEQYLTEPIAY